MTLSSSLHPPTAQLPPISKIKFSSIADLLDAIRYLNILYNPEISGSRVIARKLGCERGELLEKQTQPPRPFTDATLLSAMTGIARFVQDKELKKVLRATDGLGTEATRAGIIELLFRNLVGAFFVFLGGIVIRQNDVNI